MNHIARLEMGRNAPLRKIDIAKESIDIQLSFSVLWEKHPFQLSILRSKGASRSSMHKNLLA